MIREPNRNAWKLGTNAVFFLRKTVFLQKDAESTCV
jgi:hypothetical protein